jgi:hypothetical protein
MFSRVFIFTALNVGKPSVFILRTLHFISITYSSFSWRSSVGLQCGAWYCFKVLGITTLVFTDTSPVKSTNSSWARTSSDQLRAEERSGRGSNGVFRLYHCAPRHKDVPSLGNIAVYAILRLVGKMHLFVWPHNIESSANRREAYLNGNVCIGRGEFPWTYLHLRFPNIPD